MDYLPSGKLPHNYGKLYFLMGKSTISMISYPIGSMVLVYMLT